jgi:hypothetical protein
VEVVSPQSLGAIRQALASHENGRVWATRVVGLGLFAIALGMLYLGARLGHLIDVVEQKR